MNKNVLLISMGGTIAGNVAATKKEGEIIKKGTEFAEVLNDACTSIKNTQGIDIVVRHQPSCDIDSSDISPKEWTDLAQVIKDKYDDFDAFIVTHGTNTMGYTAAALSFSLANLDKPVVITGSQVPAGMPGSDAISNLENSLRIATLSRKDKPNIKGVVAVFGSHIITGTRIKKQTEFDYDAFTTFSGDSIGRIGRMIDINEVSLKKHLGYLSTAAFQPARNSKELICENEFDMRIVSLTEFPGMSEKTFETLVRQDKVKGFILRAFGAGDASSRLLPAFEYLKKEEIPIVITTQVPKGNSNFQVNEPGYKIAEGELAIPAYDMSIESITAKLGWLLAKKDKGELSYKQVCDQMKLDIRGEIKVIWEVTK